MNIDKERVVNKIGKPLLLVGVIIVFCSVLVHVFSGSETLSEYAEKNPEIAYREKEPELIPPKSVSSNAAAQSKGDDNIINSKEPEVNEEADILENANRIEYKPGFYYEPLSEDLIKRITGISYPLVTSGQEDETVEAVNMAASRDEIQVSYDDLCYVSVMYYNFKGIERSGELICNKVIANDLMEIFYELHRNAYQIEQIQLIDEYNGDDTLSMSDNNTSCFNYRVVDGTTSLSKHALGLAIDINPFYNPYVVFKNDGTTYISPPGSEIYADRSNDFSYKIDENDLCYKLFTERGFIWGGSWNSMKDYQHFQKNPD